VPTGRLAAGELGPWGGGYSPPLMVLPERHTRREDGLDLPFLVWRLPAPCRAVSSAVLGGGIGLRSWILNAQVRSGYDRLDPADHLLELADRVGLGRDGAPGVGLLTAADVDDRRSATDGGVRVDATVGIRVPTWAAATPASCPPGRHGPAPSTSSPSCPAPPTTVPS
jgi:adenosylcobinamide hydrolase